MSPAVVFFLYMLCGNIFEIREEVSKNISEIREKVSKNISDFREKLV